MSDDPLDANLAFVAKKLDEVRKCLADAEKNLCAGTDEDFIEKWLYCTSMANAPDLSEEVRGRWQVMALAMDLAAEGNLPAITPEFRELSARVAEKLRQP